MSEVPLQLRTVHPQQVVGTPYRHPETFLEYRGTSLIRKRPPLRTTIGP